ncbi:hypothetical protein AVEN_43165-1, partial [Araneus ventricosus]
VTEDDILSEVTDKMENNEEEDDDKDPLQSLLTTQETLQSVQSLRTFFSKPSPTKDYYFHALDYETVKK